MIRILLTFWLAWQTASPEALQHLQAGTEADKQRHFDVAIAEFKKVTELAPNLPDGFRESRPGLHGESGLRRRHPAAEARAANCRRTWRPRTSCWDTRCLSQGYNAEAIPHLEKVQEQTALGIAQIGTGQLQQAVENLQAALAKHPNDPDLLYYLGRASGLFPSSRLTLCWPHIRIRRALIRRWRKIILCCDRCPRPKKNFAKHCGFVPTLPNCIWNSAWCTPGSSQWPKAEEEFRAQTKLQPGNAEAAYRLGSALLQQGKAREARTRTGAFQSPAAGYARNPIFFRQGCGACGRLSRGGKGVDKTALHRESKARWPLRHISPWLASTASRERSADAERETQEFQKLQSPATQPERHTKISSNRLTQSLC